MPDTPTRLNKYLALRLGISRRQADALVEEGKVTVNGRPATLGNPVSAGDEVAVSGKIVGGDQPELIYIALNKPAGYVCSRRSQGSYTIYDILPPEFHHLNSVGRLDKNSSGLLLLTNDGDFTYHMTHPQFAKTKIYKVRLDHNLEPLHQQMISDFGVNLPDGRSQLTLERISDDNRQNWQVTMHEGRNRQIRRTFASLGYEVTRLHRTNFGPYALADLKRGEWQKITP